MSPARVVASERLAGLCLAAGREGDRAEPEVVAVIFRLGRDRQHVRAPAPLRFLWRRAISAASLPQDARRRRLFQHLLDHAVGLVVAAAGQKHADRLADHGGVPLAAFDACNWIRWPVPGPP